MCCLKHVLNDTQHSTELPCHGAMHAESRTAYMFTNAHAEIQSEVKCMQVPPIGTIILQYRLTCQSRDEGVGNRTILAASICQRLCASS